MFKTALIVALLGLAGLGLAGCADGGPSDNNTAALMLLGGLNGFNGARQVSPMVSTHCTAVGAVVNCLSY